MSSIPNSLKNYKIALTMLVILTASIWFALNSQPVAMRRESIPVQGVIVLSLEISPEFEEALYQSMQRGYCQAVNWDWAEVA